MAERSFLGAQKTFPVCWKNATLLPLETDSNVFALVFANRSNLPVIDNQQSDPQPQVKQDNPTSLNVTKAGYITRSVT